VEELLRDADVALYEAKGRWKAALHPVPTGMRRAVESHVELQKDLGLAVERDEFFLVYQPIFRSTRAQSSESRLCFAGSTHSWSGHAR